MLFYVLRLLHYVNIVFDEQQRVSLISVVYSIYKYIHEKFLYYSDRRLYYYVTICRLFHLQIAPHTYIVVHIYKSIPFTYSYGLTKNWNRKSPFIQTEDKLAITLVY